MQVFKSFSKISDGLKCIQHANNSTVVIKICGGINRGWGGLETEKTN